MLLKKCTLYRLLGWSYLFLLLFAVLGIRIYPGFKFRVAKGYNLKVYIHLPSLGKMNHHFNLLSQFDWLMNIALFIFFPLAIRCLAPKTRLLKVLIWGMFSSICIELLQYFFDLGLADINDVMANTFGCAIGVVMIFIWIKLKRSAE